MGEYVVNVGQKLPITLLLGSGLTGKYVQVKLYSSTFVQQGLPLLLTEVLEGLYGYPAGVLKDTEDFNLAKYRVYDDAGLTIRTFDTEGDQDSIDVFVKQTAPPPSQQTLDLLTQILAKLDGLALPGASIRVVVDDLEADVQLVAAAISTEIAQQETTIALDSSGQAAVKLESNQVDVQVNCPED